MYKMFFFNATHSLFETIAEGNKKAAFYTKKNKKHQKHLVIRFL